MQVSRVSFGNAYIFKSGKEAAKFLERECVKRGETSLTARRTYGAAVNIQEVFGLIGKHEINSGVLCGTGSDAATIRNSMKSIHKKPSDKSGVEALKKLLLSAQKID